MRPALPTSGRNSGRPKSLPAPVGGWNALNSVADMPASDALVLDNFWPQASNVSLRKGSATFSTLPAGKEIRTLMGYKSSTGTAKIFAAAQDGIYDVTSGNPLAAASAGTDSRWQHTNIATAGGSFLWCCNAVDNPRYFDGTAWNILTATSTPAALTGIATPSSVCNVSLFKTRLILCVTNSLSFWYLPTNSIGGAASEFPLGALFSKGGYLMATTTWTIDTSSGPVELFVAITSEGEVAVYSGTDPSSASTFSLVGVFKIAPPVSRRCFVRMNGETLVLTASAIAPLSKTLHSADPSVVALSRKIERAWRDFAAAGQSLFGWQAQYFPEASMLLVNVPLLNYATRNIIYSCQFAMNTTTGAWCRFVGLHSEAWLAFNGNLYFALHNVVSQAWTGTSDTGATITGTAKTAFSLLGSNYAKQIKLVRPILTSGGSLSIQLGVDVDYADNVFTSSAASYVQQLSKWDAVKWNAAKWNGSSTTIATWRAVNCKPGRAAAIRLRASSKDATMAWNATDLILEDAGMM